MGCLRRWAMRLELAGGGSDGDRRSERRERGEGTGTRRVRACVPYILLLYHLILWHILVVFWFSARLSRRSGFSSLWEAELTEGDQRPNPRRALAVLFLCSFFLIIYYSQIHFFPTQLGLCLFSFFYETPLLPSHSNSRATRLPRQALMRPQAREYKSVKKNNV